MKTSLVLTILILVLMSTQLSLSCDNETSSDPAVIENQEWILESLGESTNLQATLDGTEITLTFASSKDEVRGNAGCNSYFGQYEINGDELSIGQLGHTEMYCMDPQGIMEQEQKYLSTLQTAKSFKVTDQKLQIDCDKKVLIFIERENLPPATMPPLDDGVRSILMEVSCNEFAESPHITRDIEITYPGSLVVSLCSNPSTGFQWEEVKIVDESVVYETERNFVSPEDSVVVGGSGKDVWSFNSGSRGTSTLIFQYSRPWEGGEQNEWTCELTVVVK